MSSRTDEEDRYIRCQRKRVYYTKKAAEKFIRARVVSERGLRPYRCKHCTWYHIGHHGGTSLSQGDT